MRICTLCALLLSLLLGWSAGTAATPETIVGLPCEECDSVFVSLPPTVASTARIAPADEPGQPLQLSGRTVDADGRPVAGILVYAYHTDASGQYPRAAALHGTSARQHGRLRGWARSDANGSYRFDTIRPAGYPGRSDPEHIHLHVIEPGRCTYYIDDVNFSDDPRQQVSTRQLPQRGGSGVVTPRRDASGTWQARRDILLGRKIPDYRACGEPT